jgi:hypothetical protein
MAQSMIQTMAKWKRYLSDSAFRRSFSYQIPSTENASPAIPPHYLTTATIIRGEAKYIREFVAFHKLVGVDHMLIFMDGGFDQLTHDAISDFIANKFVTLISWPRFIKDRNNQFLAYQFAVAEMRGRTTWLTMIDADEFLFAPISSDLKAELRKREHLNAIAVYSCTFGTAGVDRIPEGGLVTETLTKRGSYNHIKNRTQRTIAKPEFVKAIRSANSCVLKDTQFLGWDEVGVPVRATGEAGHPCNALRINHYFTRAEEDFKKKLERQYFGKSLRGVKIDAKRAEASDGALSVEDDFTLAPYLPELKKLIGRQDIA